MSKAAKAIRHGGVRIKSLGSGHTGLKIVVSDLSSLRKRMKESLDAHTVAIDSVDKWAQDDDTPALQDVLHQVAELHCLWVEAQRDFVGQWKEYKRVYEHILETDKKLDQSRKNLASWEEKEKKFQKELSKGTKAQKDTDELEQKLVHAQSQRELAVVDVRCLEHESKVIKMMSVKGGLQDLSQAMAIVAEKMGIMAQAQQELARLIPESSERSEALPTYTGAKESSRVLFRARSSLKATRPPSYKSVSKSAPSAPLSTPPPGPPPGPPPSYSNAVTSPTRNGGLRRHLSAPTRSAWRQQESHRSAWREDVSPQSAWQHEEAPQSTWQQEQSSQSAWQHEEAPQSTWQQEQSSRSSWQHEYTAPSTWQHDEYDSFDSD